MILLLTFTSCLFGMVSACTQTDSCDVWQTLSSGGTEISEKLKAIQESLSNINDELLADESQCSEISNPVNGKVEYSANSSAPFDQGTTATYVCDLGYAVANGSDTMRTCILEDSGRFGVWNGTAPSCDAVITCPILEFPINGSIYYSNGYAVIGFGATATYVCNSLGLVLSGGNPVRTCGPSNDSDVGQWSGEAPSCEPIWCPSLPPPRNGQITFSGNGTAPFDYGTTATYSCDSTYVLASNGDPVRVCGSNGTFCDSVKVCGGDGTSTVGEWNGDSLVCTIEDPCLTKLYIMAFTSNDPNAGSDSAHSVEVEINREIQILQLYNIPGDTYLQNKGDLWKIDFSDFGFSETCITIEEIDRVSIIGTSTDGWIIDSIATFVIYSNGDSKVLTQDFDVRRRVDSDTTAFDRRFDLSFA